MKEGTEEIEEMEGNFIKYSFLLDTLILKNIQKLVEI